MSSARKPFSFSSCSAIAMISSSWRSPAASFFRHRAQHFIQAWRDFALVGGQVAVTRTQRQAIFRADDRHADDLNVVAHVGDHLADQRQLLEVFLAEAGDVWLNKVEQLTDDGRHAAEMARRLAPSSMVDNPGTST